MTSLASKPAISLSRIAIYAVLILAVLLYLVPLVVMLLTSFKTPEDITTGNLLSWPTVVTGIGWIKAWDTVDGYFWNSIKITVPAVLISTAIGALNGYVLSFWRFRGSQLFFGLLLFGCFLPFQTVLLPASFTLGKMGLASTTTGLVFVHVVYGLAFTTLFFRNYYVSIPDALIKAARLDGAGFFTIFRQIILPMSTPIIMVCLIWQFTQIWNDFLFGVVFSSGDSQPITVALNNLVNTSTGAKDAPRQVHWLAVAPDLIPLAVDGLTSEVVEHRYVSVLVKQSNGTYKYESRIKNISQPAAPLVMTKEGAKQSLNTGTPGDFTLQLKDANGNLLNQIDYSVAGRGNTSRSLERNAELQLRLDKRSYATGDEIAISIRAPYTGAGLITIERDKVYTQQWFKADSTNSVQHIRVPAGLEGNAYVNVQFVRDIGSAEVYMSPLSYGVVPFSINLDARRMALKVEGPAKIEPGQTLDIKVNADRPGRAVVYAVDEGILQVARYQTPDPLGFFFQKRALEVGTSQILDQIGRAHV